MFIRRDVSTQCICTKYCIEQCYCRCYYCKTAVTIPSNTNENEQETGTLQLRDDVNSNIPVLISEVNETQQNCFHKIKQRVESSTISPASTSLDRPQSQGTFYALFSSAHPQVFCRF
ncbi:hypothetical protein ILYODFUR_020336 [Ilyodon furcidens]|uniref:Uncharacterized protein n=1 Tax=Ilyodon furcidens TaxID=33524 RepID=A0ABV0SNI1_9TELE